MLDEIIKNNSELTKHSSIIPILKKIEELIPENARENFYRNLSTLKVELSETEKESCYYFNNNKIVINPNFKQYLIGQWNDELSQSTSQYLFDSTLCHEFIHMASTKYFDDINLTNSGFEAIMPDNRVMNMYLNEGFTEMLTEYLYPEAYIHSDYKDTINIASLLTSLVGIDSIKQLYFSNSLAIGLQNQLSEFANEKDIKILFSYVNNMYWCKQLSKNEDYTLSLKNAVFYGLKPIILNGLKYGIKNGTFQTEQDLNNYYNNYIKFHLNNLINIMKTNKIDPLLLTEELQEFNTENFSGLFVHKQEVDKNLEDKSITPSDLNITNQVMDDTEQTKANAQSIFIGATREELIQMKEQLQQISNPQLTSTAGGRRKGFVDVLVLVLFIGIICIIGITLGICIVG